MSTTAASAVALVATAALALAAGAHPGDNLWTTAQAASITSVRGHPMVRRKCHGLGTPRRTDGRLFYRHLGCSGVIVPSFAPEREVLVTYKLHPLEPYHGPRSRHALSDVRFLSFGVP